MADATGGRITEVPKDLDAAVAQSNKDEKEQVGILGGDPQLTLSIEYEDEDFEDDSLIAQGPRECTATLGDVDYWLPVMSPGWNDQIDSFRNYSNCWVQHFEHSDFQGGWIGPGTSEDDMGDIGDKTSSIRWT